VNRTFRVAVVLLFAAAASQLRGQQSTAPSTAAAPAPTSAGSSSPTQKSVEAYLRHLYAFGKDVQVTVGPLKDTSIPGLQETDINVVIGENKEAAKFFVSKDGKYLLRGDLSDITKDPLAENRAKIESKDAPVMGEANAPVTIVEYSDFECPVCKNLHDAVRSMLPTYKGQVKVIFKDFPIEQIHPWARTAAIAGRCAYQQEPTAFWKMYDSIYDNQELISASNAWTKMLDFAGDAHLNPDSFKLCMASPEPGAAIDASRANGQMLEVNSTPTVFVNGRRFVGADPHLLEQYINYELAQSKLPKGSDKK
jgi:protein-disulfide isomerase